MMALMLANSLVSRSGGLGPGYDPSAQAYITAVETAKGSSMTTGQKDAINAFIVAEKAASRWSSHMRLFLPVWANAAANAIDMKTLAVGTFSGSPTHAAGYIQGNGTSSLFRDTLSPTALGITSTSGYVMTLISQADSRTDARSYMGSRNMDSGLGEVHIYQVNATQVNSIIGRGTNTEIAYFASTPRTAIFHSNRNPSGIVISRRATAGVTRGIIFGTGTDAISTVTMTYMALRSNATDVQFSDARFGGWAVGSGLANDAAVDAFTLNFKTLWETVTGLTLP